MSTHTKPDFEGQRDGEQVMLVFRRHWLAIKKGIICLCVLIGLGILPLAIRPGDVHMFWIFLACVGLGLIILFYTCILWYFSIYIVTDQRIRQIRQKGLFRRTVVDLGLDKIQSIAYDIPGIKAGILRYGTILIQTGVGNLTISMVPKPAKIYNALQNIANGEVKMLDDDDDTEDDDDGELILEEI